MFPPHTRGSTARKVYVLAIDDVSPAYAGIDLPAVDPPLLEAGFPRIRGDRPTSAHWHLTISSFPPHTRGSTVVKHNTTN